MNLKATDSGWLLPMKEARVQRIEVDFRLGLILGDKCESVSLYIETLCHLKCKGYSISLIPGEASGLGPVLELFQAEVANISIQRSGHLIVMFRNGCSLEVDPNDMFEAWQIGSNNGFLLICSPGGAVSLFQKGILTETKPA